MERNEEKTKEGDGRRRAMESDEWTNDWPGLGWTDTNRSREEEREREREREEARGKGREQK